MFNQSKRIRFAIEIVLTVLFFAIVYALTGFVYETQDDFYIESILSGRVTGKCEWWILEYNHPVLMFLLFVLYSLTVAVNWYGLLLMLLRVTVFYLLLHGIGIRTRGWIWYGLTVILFFLLQLGFYYANTRIQYTSTAGIVAITGYACYVVYKNRKWAIVILAVMELFAYALRPNAMLIMTPMGFALLLLLLAENAGDEIKELGGMLKQIGLALGITLGIILLGTVSAALLRLNPDIKASATETKARMEIFDYTYHPAYEDVKDILEEKGWSENRYQAFLQYLILDYDAKDGILLKIALRRPADDHSDISLITIVKEVLDATVHYEIDGISMTVVLLWALVLFAVIYSGNWMYLIVAFSCWMAKLVAWGYMIWIRRAPVRVTLPLLYAEALTALLIIALTLSCSPEPQEKKSVIGKCTLGVCAMCMLVLGGGSLSKAYTQIRILRSQKKAENYVAESLEQCQDYCREHPGNAYILSNEICTFYRKDVLSNKIAFDNYVLSGDWYAILPGYTDFVQEYLGSKENCYFLINESIPGFVLDTKLNYLEEYFGYKPALVDSIDLVSGEKCNVYQVSKSNN